MVSQIASKVDGASMGPTWVLSAPDGPILAPSTLLLGMGLQAHLVRAVFDGIDGYPSIRTATCKSPM